MLPIVAVVPIRIESLNRQAKRVIKRWTPEEDAYIDANRSNQTCRQMAEALGRTESQLRNRCWQRGLTFFFGIKQPLAWSDAEVELLRKQYVGVVAGEQIKLDKLAAILGRHKTNVCRKAKELGFTNQRRNKVAIRKERKPKFDTQEARSAASSARIKLLWTERDHPRGMLGKRHTPETLARIAEASSKNWAAMSEAQIGERNMKLAKLRAAAIAAGTLTNERSGVTWKGGWREVGDQRKYFRSRWEANYARYLEWLRTIGQIASWQHEAHTFWFDGIKRGCVSYLPDFKVTNPSGSVEWHEVKGWMDDRSATVLKRMAKYHPHEKLILIGEKQYKEIKRKVSTLVPGWES